MRTDEQHEPDDAERDEGRVADWQQLADLSCNGVKLERRRDRWEFAVQRVQEVLARGLVDGGHAGSHDGHAGERARKPSCRRRAVDESHGR